MPQLGRNVEQPEMNPKPHEFMNFDTHRFIKSLVHRGFKEDQAEAVVDLVAQSRNHDMSRVATKEQIIKLDAKIDAVDAKLDAKLDAKIDAVNAKIDAVEERLGARIDAVEERLENKIHALDTKIDAVEERLGAKIDTVEVRLKAFFAEGMAQNTRWIMSILLAIIGLTITMFFKSH